MSKNPLPALLSVAALAAASLLAVTPASAAPVPAHAPVARAAAAPTGTIVLIRAHNVWLTRPDGSGLRQVTKDGTEASPYEHPTMSDAGVIAVMKGSSIVRMRQDGVVLNRITPEDLFVPDYATVTISPVLDPEISPDGTKIAYSQLRLENYSGRLVTESLTGFTDATQWVGPDKYGIVDGYQPSWMTNSRVALNKAGDVHVADLGRPGVTWFYSNDVFGQFVELVEPEVSPDGTRVLFGAQGAGFAMKSSVGDPRVGTPAPPTASPECYLTPDPGEPGAVDATFGPDSDSAAYVDEGDLWVVRGLAACGPETTLTRIVTGGSEPSWSPAALSAPLSRFVLVAPPALSGRPVAGRRLRASTGSWSPAPARVTYTWLRNGKVVRGRTGATYLLGRADRGQRIQVRVTAQRSGYAARAATSRAVTVRR